MLHGLLMAWLAALAACTVAAPPSGAAGDAPLLPWRTVQGAPDPQGRFVQLARPVAVAGWQDHIFIADAGRDRIYRYDRVADRLVPFYTLPLAPDTRLISNAAGELYVTDPGNRQVLRLDVDGRVAIRFQDFNLNRPVALADDPRGGRLLVLDGPYQQVLAFNRLGRLEAIVHPRDEQGQPPGNLIDLAADQDHLYLLDGARREVLVVDRQGRFVSRFGASQLRQPIALIRDVFGRILVADAFDNRIWIFPARHVSGSQAVTVAGVQIRDLGQAESWLFVADAGMGAVHILRVEPPAGGGPAP